jgi:hypothetical protein
MAHTEFTLRPRFARTGVVGDDTKGQAREQRADVRYAAAIIALSWCVSAEFANAAPLLELHIGQNGYAHFGSGPQLNSDQLRNQIHILMKKDPRPNIVMMPDRSTKYEIVEKVIGLFQREGYGPHFGIVGVDQ